MSATPTMTAPDEACFRRDLKLSAFLIGETERRWRLVSPPGIQFPHAVFAVSAATRASGPDEFHFRVTVDGYPSRAPTTRLWDIETNSPLAIPRYPKGRGNVAKVFRTNWPSEAPGSCLYHPMDRRPLSDHPDWPKIYANETWNPRRTIIDLLEVIYDLLNSTSYSGV